MAWGSSRKAAAITALGQMVGLILGLYVFDEILDVVLPLVNTSTYFGTAVVFMQNLLPVVGIIGAFGIIYNTLKKMGML